MMILLLSTAGTVTWYVSADSVKSFEEEHFITIHNSDGLEQ
jgi:hypothetical protein